MNRLEPFKTPIYITRPILPSLQDTYKKLREIWDSKILTNMGIQHQELKSELKKYLEVKYLSLFCNGTLALQLALQALEISGEVITTPFTFPATINSLYQNHLTPIFCDIEAESFNINPSKIEELITPRTSAILPVHVFGNPCEIEKIERFSKSYDLKIIYDAAHCFGIKYKNHSIGAYGDISMFSFHATKIFHTIEGGVLTYNTPDLEEKLYLLKNFGIKNEESVLLPGTNAKMNEIQAAIGLLNLKIVDDEIQKRKVLHYIYKEQLEDVEGISYQHLNPDLEYNYQYFPLLIDESTFKCSRDQLYNYLKKYNVFARKYFYPLATQYNFVKNNTASNLSTADTISRQILCLPIYGELNIKDVIKICDIIKECKRI